MASMLLLVSVAVCSVGASEGCTVGSAYCGTGMDCLWVDGVGKCVPKPQPDQPSHQGCTVGSAECGTEMDCQSVNGVGKCVLKPQPAQPSEHWECRPLLGECGTDMMCQSVNCIGKCMPKPRAQADQEEQRQYFPETDAQMRKQHAGLDPEEVREFF